MKLRLRAALDAVRAFRSRQGLWVAASLLAERVGGFLLTAVMARTLTPAAFGELAAIRTAAGVVQPLSGGGGQHALLRFGATMSEASDKTALTLYALTWGLFLSLAPIAGLVGWHWMVGSPFSREGEIAFWIMAAAVASYSLFETVRNHLRIVGDNRRFAAMGMIYTAGLVAGGLLASRWGMVGFALLFALLPLAAVAARLPALLRAPGYRPTEGFWRYGIHVGAGALVNQLFFSLDILILTARGTDPAQIALYKIATVIPYSLFFLPGSVLTADFVHLAGHAADRRALTGYLRSYFALFGLLTPLMLAALYLLSEPLLRLCFGEGYAAASPIQEIFLVGLGASFLLRIPMGNLLQAVGRADWNVAHALILAPFAAAAMSLAVARYGLVGAAWTASGTLLISGIVSALLVRRYVNTLPAEEAV